MRFKFLFVVFVSLVGTRAFGATYNTDVRRDPKKLNVHIVCHTHDDPGWLKTFEQYVYGQRGDIQVAGVNYILDSTVEELQKNPTRKFVYGEMIFFSKWWQHQVPETKEAVRKLVKSGQLEFVNGGWVQHDEAAAHYVGMIDQTTRGHKFLRRTFDVAPRVAWQIDPFGHSATQASLMSAEAGFDALFFGRIDYQDFNRRVDSKELEFVWRASQSLGSKAEVFTGVFSHGNVSVYLSPKGFGWEWGIIKDTQQVVDDESSVEYNVPYIVDLFYNATMEYKAEIYGNDLMLLMGGDFGYATARMWFDNLDKIIHYVNKDGRLNVFYSTPSMYIDAKHSDGYEWSVKTDDFMPHADSPHCYWTGYYTSRTSSKRYVRLASSYLQVARQLEAFFGVQTSGPNTDSLEDAVSLCQHHDSITGTEKQHVDDDYNRLIAIGLEESGRLVMDALARIAKGEDLESPNKLTGHRMDPKAQSQNSHWDGIFEECHLLNSSICTATVSASEIASPLFVIAYNSLAWLRRELIRVPLGMGSAGGWKVTGPAGVEIPSQTALVSRSTSSLQQILLDTRHVTSDGSFGSKELAFIGEMPPLGFAVFRLSPKPVAGAREPSTTTTFPTDGTESPKSCQSLARSLDMCNVEGVYALSERPEELDNGYISLDNGVLKVNFDQDTGRLVSIHNLETGVGMAARHTLEWYNSYDAGVKCCYKNDFNPSGPYIFRPNDTNPMGQVVGEDDPVSTRMVRGSELEELTQEYADWLSVTWRLWKGERHVEMEWTVGPIPMGDGLGKEVISRFNTSLSTNGTFYTDSNGREMLKRIKNVRQGFEYSVNEPVAGNYYPITAVAMIRQEPMNEQPGAEFIIVTDRSHGAASLDDGVIEVMLHRTTTVDDWRGAEENLNETMCGCHDCGCIGLVARGVHHITLQSDPDAAKVRRNLQQRLNDPIVLGFAHQASSADSGMRETPLAITQWSMLHGTTTLPPNVHLLTLKAEGNGRLLIRLVHLFQVEEDEEMSQPVTVDLWPLLGNGTWKLTELSVSTAHVKADMRRLQWKTRDAPSQAQRELLFEQWQAKRPSDLKSTEVVLYPMDIKTFEASPIDDTSADSILM